MTTEAPAPYTRPLPEPTRATQPFWDGLRQHRLVLQRSKLTGQFLYYPREVSPFGVADELEWHEVSGRGTVYSFTIARRPTAPQWSDAVPYVIAIVQLDEGPRLTTNIVECNPDSVRIGMRVHAAFVDATEDATILQFRPDELSESAPAL